MPKRLYKQTKRLGKELDAILKQLSQATDTKLVEQNTTIRKFTSTTITLAIIESRIFSFFMS